MSDDDSTTDSSPEDRKRRWRLAIGTDDPEAPMALSDRDKRLDRALSALYGDSGKKGRGSLSGSAPRVARWLGDIREFFPAPVVRVIQQDAIDRLGMRSLLMQPEMLEILEPDIHLVADLISLRDAMPEESIETARLVVRQVVDELLERLSQKTAEAIRGALDRTRRIARPRPADIDWHRTIQANLRHWQPAHRTIVPEKLIGFGRKSQRLVDLEDVILCVDQSGSMATSVVYASIFAAVLASLPGLRLQLVCFDTQVLDLTDQLEDPVQVLFGVQLGGGTDIAGALGYTSELVQRPTQTHLVLISDLYEGGNEQACLARAAALVASGVQLIVLLALSDDGTPGYDPDMAGRFAALGCPVFGCTPDQFPELMAAALQKQDVAAKAQELGIAPTRPGETALPDS